MKMKFELRNLTTGKVTYYTQDTKQKKQAGKRSVEIRRKIKKQGVDNSNLQIKEQGV